jgi:hypothetical protein
MVRRPVPGQIVHNVLMPAIGTKNNRGGGEDEENVFHKNYLETFLRGCKVISVTNPTS